MVANDGILFNKCSKMLYFLSNQTYLSSKSSINRLLDVTLCGRRAFGSYCPLRYDCHLDSSKKKLEQISFRKYSRSDALRVADLKFNLATSCENLHYVNCGQQRSRSACPCSLSSIRLFASMIAGYLLMLKPA